MSYPESTCWTMVQAAAEGSAGQREEFALRYLPVIRHYLAARWRRSAILSHLDDAVQEVFVECFKGGGILDKAVPGLPGGFRSFLYGVVRNVALRIETRSARARKHQSPGSLDLDQIAGQEESFSRIFDRAWAKALLRQAGSLMEAQAKQMDESARRRVELLRLRFHENLPIREIARRWETEASVLHHEYAQARQEFKAALLEVVAFHQPGASAALEQECINLLSYLA
jgi:RNA polymerase sigma-70 factor (ECF subfamily)